METVRISEISDIHPTLHDAITHGQNPTNNVNFKPNFVVENDFCVDKHGLACPLATAMLN
jgi:hypothetical protein